MNRSCSQNGSTSKFYQVNLQYKISLGKPRRRWEDTTRMDLKEIGVNTINWVDSAKNRDYWRALVNVVFLLRVSLAI